MRGVFESFDLAGVPRGEDIENLLDFGKPDGRLDDTAVLTERSEVEVPGLSKLDSQRPLISNGFWAEQLHQECD